MKKNKNKNIIKAQKGVSKIIAKTAKQIPVSDFEKLVLDFPINGKGNAALWEAAGIDMSKYPSDLSERLAHMQKVRLNILQRGNPYQITNVADKYQITSYFPTGTSDNRLGYIHLNDNSDDEFGIRWVEKITPSMSKYGLDPYTAIGYNAAKQYSDIFRRGLLSGEELLQPGKTVPHVRTYFNTTVKRNPDGTWVVGKYHEPNEREAAARQLMASQNKTYVSEKEINDFLNRGEESKYVEVPAAVGEEWNVSSFPEYFDENGNFKKNLPEDLIDELSVNLKEGVPGFYQQYIGTLKRPLAMPNKLYTPFIHPYVYESGDLFRRMPNLGIFSTFKNGGTIKLQKAGVVPKVLSKFLKNTAKPVLDKSLEGVPKVIEYTPKVIVSEPYARLSRDLSTVNKAWSFSIDGDPFNTFQLVKDIEPKQYSVHFKTLGKNALTEPQKQQLFQAVADAIPGDSYLSTWGSVSKGGLAGLKRFEGLGFKPTLQTRLLGLKILPTAEEVFPFGEVVGKQIEVPILYKPKGVVAGSRPISFEERLGIPKGERNQPAPIIDRKLHERFLDDRKIITPVEFFPPTLKEIELMPEEHQKNVLHALKKWDTEMIPHNRYYFADKDEIHKFNVLLQDYISTLDSDIDQRFKSVFNEDGLERPSLAVRAFRNYLYKRGLDAHEISNDDLAKFLTSRYKELSSQADGKLKEDILWHGSKTDFDSFDFSHTGENTGNSGALGPGNYFTLTGGGYGITKNPIDYTIELNNTQPYIITGIVSTPNGLKMIKKGILPTYIGPHELSTPAGKLKLQRLIESIPKEDNRAYIDPEEQAGLILRNYNAPSGAIMVRRNTGIKSLFPHPSRFIRNEDGTVRLIPTDWSDIRVNYKKGGIINKFKNKFHK